MGSKAPARRNRSPTQAAAARKEPQPKDARTESQDDAASADNTPVGTLQSGAPRNLHSILSPRPRGDSSQPEPERFSPSAASAAACTSISCIDGRWMQSPKSRTPDHTEMKQPERSQSAALEEFLRSFQSPKGRRRDEKL